MGTDVLNRTEHTRGIAAFVGDQTADPMQMFFSAILRRQGIGNEVECIETLDGVLLRPIKSQELSFEDAFAQMAKDQEALDEVHEFEGTLGDGLEQDRYSN